MPAKRFEFLEFGSMTMGHAMRPRRHFGCHGANGTVAALVFIFGSSNAPGQTPTWLREFGGFGVDYAEAALATSDGGLIIAGGTASALFAPVLGFDDVFIARFDEFGNLVSGAQFGTSGSEGASRLVSDGAEGVYAAGTTTGSLGQPPGLAGGAWLARCNGSGSPVWIRQLNPAPVDYVRGLCQDGAGGAIMAFGPFGIWFARYTGSGELVWLKQFGATISVTSGGIVADGSGGFFACGHTSGNLFGPLAGDPPDPWIARFDSRGDVIWGQQIGTPQWDAGRVLSADGLGGVYFAGETSGIMAGTTPGGAWIARYDALGARHSIVQFGAGFGVGVWAISRDGFGGAFVGGTTTGSFGGPHAGGNDAWIAHVAGGTSVAWVHQLGTPQLDGTDALALAGPGRVFAAGSTLGNLATGGGGGEDAWLARYDLCYPDCTGDGAQTVADFGCFQSRYVLADPYADCNGSGSLTIADFGCFQNKYVLGCP
ncbi:MAG: hypothetical protein ACKVU4_07290 [Phycisphaerales bacterium]